MASGSSKPDARMAVSAEAWGWRVDAACRQEDPSIFFHPEGERGIARRQRQQAAKRVCAQCPVKAQCREHSLVFAEPYGVWGGLTEDERSELLPVSRTNLRTHRAYDGVKVRTPNQ